MRERETIKSASGLRVGDVIIYPARPEGREHLSDRGELRVSRIVGRDVKGYRTHAQEWEREVEFTVFGRQIEDNWVLLISQAANE